MKRHHRPSLSSSPHLSLITGADNKEILFIQQTLPLVLFSNARCVLRCEVRVSVLEHRSRTNSVVVYEARTYLSQGWLASL